MNLPVNKVTQLNVVGGFLTAYNIIYESSDSIIPIHSKYWSIFEPDQHVDMR